MASIGEYLDRMVIEVLSPDRNITLTLGRGTEVDLRFRPGVLVRYDEPRLEHELSRLAQRAWVARQRGFDEAYRRANALAPGEQIPESDDPRMAQYRQRLGDVEGEGVSARGTVRLRTRGMLQWNVTIRPGTIQRLGEEYLLSELKSALAALLLDREMKIILIKAEYFDLGIPRAWLEAAARRRTGRR
jgi:hypothetical protein